SLSKGAPAGQKTPRIKRPRARAPDNAATEAISLRHHHHFARYTPTFLPEKFSPPAIRLEMPAKRPQQGQPGRKPQRKTDQADDADQAAGPQGKIPDRASCSCRGAGGRERLHASDAGHDVRDPETICREGRGHYRRGRGGSAVGWLR